MKRSVLLSALLLTPAAYAAPDVSPYLALGVGAQDLEGIDGQSYSIIGGIRDYYGNFFISWELEFSGLNTEDDLSYQEVAGSNDSIINDNIKGLYTAAFNVPLGYRFDVNNNFAIEPYALVGYSISRIKNHQTRSTSADNFSSSDTVYRDTYTADGLRYGGGVDMLFDENFKVGVRWTKAKISGEDIEDVDDENLSVIFGYHF